jgi:hypothetical protein
LPESTDEVLALGQVDSGLATDGRIHLRQERGGDVQVRRAPVVRGSRKSRDIGHDAAPDRDDDIGPRQPGPGEEPRQLLDRGERLGLFPVGDEADRDGRPASIPSTQPASLIDCWVTITADLALEGTKRATSWRAPGPTSTG